MWVSVVMTPQCEVEVLGGGEVGYDRRVDHIGVIVESFKRQRRTVAQDVPELSVQTADQLGVVGERNLAIYRSGRDALTRPGRLLEPG